MLAGSSSASMSGAAFLKLLQAKPQGQTSNAQPPNLATADMHSSSRSGAAAQSSFQPAAAVNTPPAQPAAGYRATTRVDQVAPAQLLPTRVPSAGLPTMQQPPPPHLHQAAYIPESVPPQQPRNPPRINPTAPVPVEQLLQRWSQPGASQSASSVSQQSIPPTAARQSPGVLPQQPAAPVLRQTGTSGSSCWLCIL